jgi:hypothetical protein
VRDILGLGLPGTTIRGRNGRDDVIQGLLSSLWCDARDEPGIDWKLWSEDSGVEIELELGCMRSIFL